jgi:hypothetical protein
VKLPILSGIPKLGLVLVVPFGAFLLAIGLTLGTSEDNKQAAVPTVAVSVSNAQALPTATPVPTVTAPPNRKDCAAIRGTDYQSADEQSWFQQNCASTTTSTAASASSNLTFGGGSGPSQPVTGPNVVAGSEYGLGDRLVIPSISVNAPVNGIRVGSNGTMPDPKGYFNAVWYDFSAIPGLGGYVGSGNHVLAGHVDSAIYGAAVFYYMRNLKAGDPIQYITSDGVTHNYVVTGVGDYLPDADWASIVASRTADMTIITCIGTFNTAIREYSHRRVVFARRG